MPPRHGKSEMISHWFPSWCFERWPRKRIILSSYEAGFASEWGRKVRNTLLENEDLLTVRLARDSKQAKNWHTSFDGGMVTAGVGGPITGRGADILIGDDLFKNWKEAASPTVRETVWNWWKSTAYTRLEPGGSVVLVMTRWHDDDLCGRLIREMEERDGEQWDVLNLPAIAEEVNDALGRAVGDALWPERYPISELARIQGNQTKEIWEALYQQHPLIGAGKGLVYKPFSKAENVKEVKFNPHLALSLACDFNVDPLCWTICQHDGNNVYVLEEIALPDSRTLEAVEEFGRRAAKYAAAYRGVNGDRPLPVKLYGDSAGDARSTAGKTDYAIIREWFRGQTDFKLEYNVPSSNPWVKDRVECVNAMLCNARGERRLFVNPSCRGLIRDFERVVWKIGTVDLDKASDKTLTHLSDGLGYLIYREYRIDTFRRSITKA
jgi:hypothetical protein